MLRHVLLLLLTVVSVWAQTDANAITVSVSRNYQQAADQAIVTLTVHTTSDEGIQRAFELVAPYGVTPANLVGFSSAALLGVDLSGNAGWSTVFAIQLPVDRATALVEKVSAARQPSLAATIAQNFWSQPWTACPFQAMLQDAQSRAKKIAAASSLNVGAILAMSAATNSTCSLTVKYSASRF